MDTTSNDPLTDPTEPVASTRTTLSFSAALALLKEGRKLQRIGWNGANMFVFLVQGSRFEVNRAPLNEFYPEGTMIEYNPHIDIKKADGTIEPWLASQSDILAEDWQLIY